MAKATFKNIRIRGISGAVPKNRIQNLVDHSLISQEEKQKTVKLTGITEYRKVGPYLCASDLCQKAAEVLFKGMDIKPKSIDAILFVTQTPDYRSPSTACLLQDKLSCSQGTITFDINLGCSGFVYGLYTACSFIQGGGLHRVLLLCGDAQTKLYHDRDKNLCLIMGDAGTATLIEEDNRAHDINMVLMTDGNHYDKLYTPAGGFRNPSTTATRKIKKQPNGGIRSQEHLYMDGVEIFNFSIGTVLKSIKTFINEENINIEDIDHLILHQSNKLITDYIARKLQFPLDKVPSTLRMFGNTSSASVPLTIAYHFSQVDFLSKRHCLLSGYGGGLSWGVVDITLENIFCPPISEI